MARSGSTWVVTCFVAVLVFVGEASAQTRAACQDGRVSNAQTAGRCCWPGQRWDRTARVCDGPPQCPAGRTMYGDDCVPLATAAAPQPAQPPVVEVQGVDTPAQPTVGMVQYAPSTTQLFVPRDRRGRPIEWEPYHGGPVPPNARVGERRRPGAFSWGAFFASVGTTAIVIGAIFAAETNCYEPGFIASCSHSEAGLGGVWIAGGLVFILGGAGLVLYGRTTFPVLFYNHGGMVGERSRPVRFAVLPVASESYAGASLVVTHY